MSKSQSQPQPPPLAGIKVVDLTRYLAGPFCTQILGDYGAEILKIEPVENPRGELGGGKGPDTYFFLSTNRSKKSVRLDIKNTEGRAILMRLIDAADIVVDNFRPGVMDALGLDYASLAARNPRIITCSISGFGSTGPLRDFPGFDQIAQGMSGLMSVTGTVESGPTRVGIAICDLLAGILSANGILLALQARHRDGRGQRVETSLLESIVSILTWSAGIYFETGVTPAPAGNNHPLSSPYGVFKASDRPFNIACGSEAMWQKFVKVIERPELADDDRFKSSGRRVKNRAALTEEINLALASQTAEHWIAVLNREGIPSGPILTIEEMFKHPQTAAREMLLKLPHPQLGEFLTTGLAAKLESTPGKITRPPLVGEHTDEVLGSNGYTKDDLKRLRTNGVIA
ncbi:CaiB/BaiF CoA transferase family protein [Candidatus Binatus sp.]|jgi:CoA:oxalate CoA-transferase|uniref:CaiB/BaiF CoA transferase family protein n=1 Tax=Candidatus Binatus sp. TaxID=2811406 RepID=UPI003CB205CB